MKRQGNNSQQQILSIVLGLSLTLVVVIRLTVAADPISSRLKSWFEPIQAFTADLVRSEVALDNPSTTERDSVPEELKQQNQQLRQKLGLKSAEDQRLQTEFININVLNLRKVGVIDKGSSDGITVGDEVVVGQTLVGVVETVYRQTADVILVGDPQFRAAVTVGGVAGVVRSEIGGASVGSLLSQANLSGKAVKTSGLGGVYQAGLVLGETSSRIEVSDSQLQSYVLRPSYDYQELWLVEVITGDDNE